MKLMIGLVAVVLCASGWLTQAQTNSGKRNIAKENPAPATGAKYLQEIYTVKVEPVKAEPVKVGPANEIESCAYLLPEKENKKLTMAEIAALIGDPVPFSVEAHGADQLIIYSSLEKVDKTTLSVLEKHINELAQFRTFEVELKIPHARAVGDLVTKVEALHSAGLTVEAVGEDRIRVSSESAPECSEWQQFLTNLREMAWRPESSSPVDRVFYLNSSDLAGALNSGGGGKGGGGEKSDNPTVNAIGSQGADKSDASSGGSAGGGAGSATGSKPSSGKSTSKGKSAQTTASSSGGANKPTGGDTDDSTDQTSSSAPDTSTKQEGPESATAAATTPDLLVFSEANPGDDRAVNEKRRIVAALDLPRPEMIVNAMSFQISSKDYKTVRRANKEVREQVSYFNDRLQAAVISGWKVVKEQSERPGGNFYNHAFYDYIARRYIGDSPAVKTLTTDQAKTPITNREAAQAFLEYRDNGKLTWSNSQRDKWGICQATKYCLGYSSLFDPVKPQLTNLLMVLIAMQHPLKAVTPAVNAMEGKNDTAELIVDPKQDCEIVDRSDYSTSQAPLRPFFECFRKAAQMNLKGMSLHLLRSSVADFLFHYKMSNEFPHEFSPYDLDLSANALNMALSPLIDAFNEDLIVYQRNLADELLPFDKKDHPETEKTVKNESDKDQKDRKAFRNYGLISVHTVAGKETVVDTATQSYLDASSAPSLAQMMNSIAQAKSSVPGIMATNLSANAATTIAGALNAMQPTEAKVGRGFKIDLMPRSLPGASAAELDVTMTVEETAEPTIYSGGAAVSSGDSFSRVAKHDTTTKMRVDSLRIFEVSSLYAQLERSRARFPLLPIPGLEIPYIGCLIGIPLRPATEYHTSVAVLGAIVVPTANDLAYGTRFEGDRIVTGTCTADELDKCVFRRPASIADLGKNIRLFHQQMVHCLAGGTVSMAPEASGGATDPCAALDISKLPSDSNW